MTHADLTFEQWNDLSDDAARRVAQEIAQRHGLSVAGLKDTVYVGRSHRVALFDRDGMRFALVPGGRPVLGYDAVRFQPAPEQAADYADSAGAFGLAPLAEYIDAKTSPVRSVELAASLIAVEAFDPCEIPLAPDDPQVLGFVASIRARRGVTKLFHSRGGLEVELNQAGEVVRARSVREVSYDEALAGLAGMGLRTTTPDEWEWACGAGAATLFRWGDDCPHEGYPYDHKTGPHRAANLWGLAIAHDPYKHEVTTERTIVCGGDGGGTTCGGSGYFLAWLTLATAHRDVEFGQWLASGDGYADEILTRPVIDLC